VDRRYEPINRAFNMTTPKLTADGTEAGGRFSDRLRDEREAKIRTKTFEAAAEARPSWPSNRMNSNYQRGWMDAVRAYTDAIRALAKEKEGHEED